MPMPLQRRNVLHLLAFASGWPLVSGRTSSAEASPSPHTPRTPDTQDAPTNQTAQTAPHSAAAPAPAQSDAKSAPAAALPAERVLGIGGLFFRANDPKSLAEWYRVHLGVDPVPTSYGQPSWHTEAGTTVFAPFSQTTKYFGDPHQVWMVNFRVRSLDRMAAQLRAAGIEVKLDPEHYPNGRFARIHDPEGNPIELWEPAVQDASHG
jgi:catechol 2,3-dioxygenase-like lactoylglutathione lyase family enzyme